LEGSVFVRTNGTTGRETTLAPGEQAQLGSGVVEVRELSLAAAKEIAAWRQGQAVFADTPLAEAVERFAGYHERKIRIDADAADLRLGGRYSLDDLDGLLAAIERVLPVRVLREDTGAVRIVASRVAPK
jgi:transmembrane sensor